MEFVWGGCYIAFYSRESPVYSSQNYRTATAVECPCMCLYLWQTYVDYSSTVVQVEGVRDRFRFITADPAVLSLL